MYKTTARQAALNKLTFSCAIAAAFAAAPVMAAVVVQDSFTTDTTTANITSRTPDDVNVAGNTYSWRKQGNGSAQTQVTGGVLETGYNHATAIQYTNAGVPTDAVTLSIDAQINSISGGNNRGIGLGFWGAPSSGVAESLVGFTGILVNPDGRLTYVSNGAVQGIFTTPPAGFSTSAYLTLTYTVDPTTSDITSLVYAGTDYTAAFTSTFVTPNLTVTDQAGFLGTTASNASWFGRADNFTVDVAPEPSSLALLGLGGLLIARRRRG